MSSSEQHAKDAINEIEGMKKIEDIFGFVQGDNRVTVQEAATVQIEKLKQGETDKLKKNDNDLKTPTTQKEVALPEGTTSIITMINSQPHRAYFCDGKMIKTEPVELKGAKK